ncbi:IS66 family insertion sequence element accessory protein TnpB [Bradyrhizobium sp. SSUT112]|uniref:IS66 family insertion sequence element accessory protein TnpB n=1 Tax=Bradyrhizobium sp. SSUT112 TaxID=3040604 RepID=UPI0024495CDC|nr:IS66 family insertion sequence element accessory protein TnpB [Bradyrhizobium sp. SSUT112]MDH2357622.1 IS66 family insertion sequence element accessory protein TnpB [Bradyrhizobium sp. SSUT112]
MGLDGKIDAHLDSSTVGSGALSRLEVLEGPSGRRVRSDAEWARIVGESLLPGAQVAEEHGATRWQIYDWRRRFRRRGELPSFEAPQPPFAPLVVDGPLEERHVPAVKLEIAIGDVVVRTDAAIDGEQLSRLIRAARASR